MRVLSFIALILVFASASYGADDAVEKELKRLQGNWQMVEVTKDGETTPAERLKGKVWTFQGDRLTPLYDKNDDVGIKIDPTKKPATLDLVDKNGEKIEGIYKFTGDDTLTICARSDSKRPTGFDAGAKSGGVLFVLERVKK